MSSMSKGKGKAYRSEDDDWSDWVWDSKSGLYYRTRLNPDAQGGYDYDYAPPQTPEVPRSEAGNTAATTKSYISSAASVNKSYSDHDGYKYQSDQKYSDSGNASSTQYVTSNYPTFKQPNENSPSSSYQDYSSSAPAKFSTGHYNINTYKTSQVPILEISQDPSDELSESFQKVAISPRPTTSQFGSLMTSAIPNSAAGPSPTHDSLNAGVSNSKNLEVQNSTRHIFGTAGKSERLDPKFRVYHSRFFTPGQVFKILWSEPEGETRANITDVTSLAFAEEGKHGEKVYHSIRRFIIVATSKRGSSSCVPILTYQHQGTTKRGVNRSDHAIVYTSKTPPTELPGEEKLLLDPIQVIPKTHRDKLDPDSRINYAKIYTVEHNVKVHFIGSLSPNSERKFMAAFDSTWANMNKIGG